MEDYSRHEGSSISDLDRDLTMEILSRLPVKTIFACKCVCNTWKLLLSHPHFAKLHFSRTPANLVYLPNSSVLHVIDVRGVESRTGRLYRDADVLKLTLKSHFPDRSHFSTLNSYSYSCNGLLCLLSSYAERPIYVCNPLLGEYIAIPKPRKGRDRNGNAGFGFCSDTNNYKLIWSHWEAPHKTQVYTLGDQNWRSIGNAPFNFPCFDDHKILVKGTVHWVCKSGGGFYIRGFHFGREQFFEIPGPFEELSLRKYTTFLGELGGCLSLQCTTFGFGNPRILEIWVLKESWTKDFVINVSFFTSSCNYFVPIMIMDSGDILLRFDTDVALVLYSPYQSFRWIYDFKNSISVVAHVPSFISLKDVAKGEEVKLCRQSVESENEIKIAGIYPN